MIPESELKERKGLAYVLNVDGFGTQGLKVAKYKEFAKQATGSGTASSSSTRRTRGSCRRSR